LGLVNSNKDSNYYPASSFALDAAYATSVSKAQARHRARHNRRPGSQLMIFDTTVGSSVQARSLIDCGSSAVLLEKSRFTRNVLESMGASVRRIVSAIKTVHGVTEQESLEVLNLPIMMRGIRKVIPRAVTADLGGAAFDIIIGIDALSAWDAKATYRRRRVEFPGGTNDFWAEEPGGDLSGEEDEPELHCVHATEVFDLMKKGGEILQVFLTSEGEVLDEPLPPPPQYATEGEQQYSERAEKFSREAREEALAGMHPEIAKLVKEFPEVLGTKWDVAEHSDKNPPAFSIPIPVSAEDRANLKPARIIPLNPSEREELRQQVMWLRKKNFIEPSSASSSSPIFFVKKSNGGLRMVIDLRSVNEVTTGDATPIPLIDSLLDRLGAGKVFSEMDLTAMYQQFGIDKADRELTAMALPDGSLVQWRSVCFGLKAAPAKVQAAMHKVFAGTSAFIIHYFDDIIVFSENLEDHLKHLRVTFERLRQYRLMASISKSRFLCEHFKFLGSQFSAKGREADPTGVRAFLDMPDPTTYKALRSWIGLAAYFADFCPKLSEFLGPLHRLKGGSEKRGALTLTSGHRECLNGIRKLMSSPAVLQLPDWSKPFTLVCDASKQAVSSCLMQEHTVTLSSGGEAQMLLPVRYRSKVLEANKSGWFPYQLELLAVLDGFRTFRRYLLFKPFLVLSDHRPLLHLRTKKQLTAYELSSLDFISMFQYDWKYLPGPKMELLPPDFLSRPLSAHGILYQGGDIIPPDCKLKDRVTQHADEFDISSFAAMQSSTSAELKPLLSQPGLELKSILSAYQTDKFCRSVLGVLESGPASHHFNDRYIRGRDGLIHRIEASAGEARVLLPKSILPALMTRFHDSKLAGHPGVNPTFANIRKHFVFSGSLFREVRDHIKRCVICAKSKPLRNIGKQDQTLLTPVVPNSDLPLRFMSTDFFGPLPESITASGKLADFVWILVCHISGAVYFVPCQQTVSAETLADLYLEYCYGYIGLPKVLISDRDPRFTASFYQQLAKQVGTDLRFATAFHAQANGLAERNVAIAKNALIPYTNHEQNNWATNLPILQLTLNNRSKLAKDGLAPNEIVLGALLQQFPEDVTQLGDSLSTPADALAAQRAVSQLRARDAVMNAQDQHALPYNAGRSGLGVQAGDLVMVDTNALKLPEEADRSSRALAFRRDGPFLVRRVLPGGRLELELPPRHRAHPIIAMEHCSIFRGAMPSKAVPSAEGPDLVVIDKILSSRLPGKSKSSNASARLEKRSWLTKFSENPQDSEWLVWKDFVDEDGTIAQPLIVFEQDRTGLVDTLNAEWEYAPDAAGVVSLRSDGFRTYTSAKGDTPAWIAKELDVPVLDLLEQNVMRMAVGVPFQGKSKLKVLSVLRIPRRGAPAVSSNFAKVRFSKPDSPGNSGFRKRAWELPTKD
jgi:hypothetical protein